MAQSDMASTDKQKACAHCGEVADMTCTGCKATAYCCREHQKEDWPLHKLLCKSFTNFQDRPFPDHHRAILLPEDKSKPRFVWVGELEAPADESEDAETEEDGEAQQEDDQAQEDGEAQPGNTRQFSRIDFGDLFRDGDTVQTSLLLLGDHTSDLGKNLDHAVYLGVGSMHQVDGSQPNQCLAANSSDPRVARRFQGPVVLFGMTSLINERKTVDLGAVDFSLVIKLLQEHHSAQLSSPIPCETTGVVVLSPKVAADRNITCYNEVYVPFDHPIWHVGDISKLSKLVRTPLLTLEWKTDKDEDDGLDENHPEWKVSPAAFLHVNFTTSANAATDTSFGRIPDEWFHANGSVLVVRQDQRPITAADVEKICMYGAQEAKRLLMAATKSPNARRDAIAKISKKDWEEFKEEYEISDGVKKL